MIGRWPILTLAIRVVNTDLRGEPVEPVRGVHPGRPTNGARIQAAGDKPPPYRNALLILDC